MNWISQEIRVEGAKIHFYQTEDGKEPIIFLHGGMDNGLCYGPIAEKFSNEYHLIMPDARGHGMTDTLDDIYTYDAMAEDVKNLIEYLDLPQVNIIGHSMGGNIGAQIAQKYPNLVKKLILEEPGLLSENFLGLKKHFIN